jgi:hypothetical protein
MGDVVARLSRQQFPVIAAAAQRISSEAWIAMTGIVTDLEVIAALAASAAIAAAAAIAVRPLLERGDQVGERAARLDLALRRVVILALIAAHRSLLSCVP